MWTALLLTAGLALEGRPLEPADPALSGAGDSAGAASLQEERSGRSERGGRAPRGEEDEVPFVRTEGPRIAWYPSLAQARAEAERTGRPILLQSAAPQCHEVPGIW